MTTSKEAEFDYSECDTAFTNSGAPYSTAAIAGWRNAWRNRTEFYTKAPRQLPEEVAKLIDKHTRIADSNTLIVGPSMYRGTVKAFADILWRIAAENAELNKRLDKEITYGLHVTAERDALPRFKDFVHKRLNDAGIEKNPDGPHSKEGCRIGDRLDIALNTPEHKAAWDTVRATHVAYEKERDLQIELQRQIEELNK